MTNQIEVGDWIVFAYRADKDQPLLTREWLMGCCTGVSPTQYAVERITDAGGRAHLRCHIAHRNARGPYLSKGEALIALRKIAEIQEAHRASRPRSEDAIQAVLDEVKTRGDE